MGWNPLSSIQEMADYYFDALQELDPEESCVLIGDGKQVRGDHLNIGYWPAR